MPIYLPQSEVEWCPTNLKKDKKTDNENQPKQSFIQFIFYSIFCH